MKSYVWNRITGALLFAVLISLGATTIASALQSSSAHYGVDETFFGSGGQLNACSSNYCSDQTAGDLAVGSTASTNYQARAGSNTNRAESLQLVVNAANIDIGTLSTTTTKVASATFSVTSYLADGYGVYVSSPGPQNGSYTLNPLGSLTASSTGSEQFGINLVANACPANTPTTGAGSCSGGYGANPVQVPDTSFSFGQVQSGYNTPDRYKYVNNDMVAYTTKSSGETDYTLSYLFNISPVTPGGTYVLQQSIVATSTY